MTNMALPGAGEPRTKWESLVLTNLSAYICIQQVHIQYCSCKEVTDYRLVLVPGAAQKQLLL